MAIAAADAAPGDAGHEDIPRVLALSDGPQNQAFGQGRGQVLEAMHREVRLPVEQGGLKLLCEETFGQLRLRQRGGLKLVPGGFVNADLERERGKRLATLAEHRVSLGQRQGAPSRGKNDRLVRHGCWRGWTRRRG